MRLRMASKLRYLTARCNTTKILSLAAACFIFQTTRCQQVAVPTAPQLPPPYATFEDSKKFNAVQFGPGNSFAIREAPPDFQLAEFAISHDGELLAMAWRSGRVVLWNIGSKRKIGEFKSGVGWPAVLKFNAKADQLVVTGSGKIAWLDLPKGKKLKEFSTPLGRYKYDVHDLVLDPNDKWLAYANEETGKVLDLSADPPRAMLDLGDAYSVALSQDGTELWTVNRSELRGFRTSNWELIGRWQLKSPPLSTSPALVRTGFTLDGKNTVAVPSSNGLLIYRAPEMSGESVTDKPTDAVAFSGSTKTYVILAREISLLNTDGHAICSKSYKGRTGYAVGGDGRWLALSQFDRVDLWRMEDLLRSCGVSP